MQDTTIIIPIRISNPTYEVYLKNLEHSLFAAAKQTIPCELILVDYGSHVNYVQKIEILATQSRFKCVRAEGEMWSRSKALNAGIQSTSGDYVLFVDADCVVPPGYAAECLQVCGPSTFSYSTVYDSFPGIIPTSNYAQLAQRIIGQGVKSTRDYGYSHMCVSSEWIARNGGYNEEYSGWGGEDNDLFLRLTRFGCSAVEINIHPIHLWHPTYEQLMTQEGQKDLYDKLFLANKARYFSFRDEKK